MDIHNIASRHAKAVPGFELVHFFDAVVPYYKVILNVTTQRKKGISVIQEFCMRLISEGITSRQEISNFLGIEIDIVREAMVELNAAELIKINLKSEIETIKLTEKGIEVLKSYKLIVPEKQDYTIIMDRLTGKLSNVFDGLLSISEVQKHGYQFINTVFSEPSLDYFEYKNISKLLKESKSKKKDNIEDGDLISINEIVKTFPVYYKVSVLVFLRDKNGQRDIDIRVFDRSTRETEYEDIILNMEKRDNIRIIPEENIVLALNNAKEYEIPVQIQKEAIEYKNSIEKIHKKIDELSEEIERTGDIKALVKGNKEEERLAIKYKELIRELEEEKKKLAASNRIVYTYEHRPLLEKALNEAKKLVVIVSPWIMPDAFNYDLRMKIDNALKRKVEVFILYGFGNESEEKKGQKDCIRELRNLMSKDHGKRLHLFRLGDSHQKVLICDDLFIVITSFNWLSFRGDPNRGIRQETGTYSESKAMIKEMINKLEERSGEKINKHLE